MMEVRLSAQEFDEAMRNYFGATRGAFSVVTKTEREDGQVTFTGPERIIADEIFGSLLDGRHGSKPVLQAKGMNPYLEYRLFPNGRAIYLTTSFKTNSSNELRYYMAADAFKPEAGDYWGIFERDGNPWLCTFSEKLLEAIRAGAFQKEEGISFIEPEMDEFQDLVNSVVKKSAKVVDVWHRNIKVSQAALNHAKYRCELFPDWRVFESKATGQPYMEAHHIVPMSLQKRFDQPLDASDNVCCLNPLSHRLVHHGRFVEFERELVVLLDRRQALLDRLQLLKEDVLSIYWNG